MTNQTSHRAGQALRRAAPRNLVLASLPADARRRLLAGAELRDLPQGSVLSREGDLISHVLFPLSAVLVGTRSTARGQVIGHGMRGRETLVYGLTAIRTDLRTSRWIVEIPGRIIAVPLADFRAVLDTSMALVQAVLTCASALLQDAEATVVCSRHHALTGRVAFVLLLLDAYTAGGGISLTHERIAAVVGTSRQATSADLGQLQKAGLIRQDRGAVALREREALAARACVCQERVTRLTASYAAGRLVW